MFHAIEFNIPLAANHSLNIVVRSNTFEYTQNVNQYYRAILNEQDPSKREVVTEHKDTRYRMAHSTKNTCSIVKWMSLFHPRGKFLCEIKYFTPNEFNFKLTFYYKLSTRFFFLQSPFLIVISKA